jgi:hypothetical protein
MAKQICLVRNQIALDRAGVSSTLPVCQFVTRGLDANYILNTERAATHN